MIHELNLNSDALTIIIEALEKEKGLADWRATLDKYGEAWVQTNRQRAMELTTLLDYLKSV